MLGDVDVRFIRALERISIGDLNPDLTFVLDVPVAIALERAAQRRGSANPDRFEAEKADFHEKLREAYLALAASAPQRCVIIDASMSKEAVAKRVWDTVNTRLDPATAPFVFTNMAS